MKNLFLLLFSFLFVNSTAISQNTDRWEEKGERIAAWAERLADKVERQAERTADNWEAWAEEIADDVERTFDRDVRVYVDGERVFAGDLCHAYLGIHSDRVSRDKARKLGFENVYGSYVTRVVEGSAAQQAGLQIFDYIYGIDEQRTSNNQDLSNIIADYRPGDEATLHYFRNGENKTAKVVFGKYNDFKWNNEEEVFLGIRPHDREDSDDLDGVKVEIVSNSTAEEMGLEDGDNIIGLNGHEILDWTDVSAAIDEVRPGQTFEIEFLRSGKIMNATAQAKERENNRGNYSSSDENWDWDWDDEDEVDGNGAFIGIYTEKISESKAQKLGYDNPYGTLISGIVPGTGAERAGLKPFDYIYGVDEYRAGKEQRLGGIMRKYEPGDQAKMHIYRKGKKKAVDITFGSYAEKEYKKSDKCQDPFFGIVQMHNSSSVDGVKVRPVSNSTAKEMGIQEGDIVTEINGYPMFDWTDITIAIEMLRPGETISVKYIRDGEDFSASKKIKSYAEAKNCDNCDCDNDRHVHINIDPDIDIRIGRDRGRDDNRDSRSEPRIDIDDVDVDMEDISSSDANDMRNKGVDMPIENSLRVNNLRLSPNPNMGMFELEFDLPTEGETSVRVYNPVGRVIYEYDLGRFSGDFADYIDISQNGEGFYFLQIKQGRDAFTRKIVLAKN